MTSWAHDVARDEQGRAVGTLAVAVLTFAGSWIYCIYEYGFLFGVGLGWLPSLIVAFGVFVLSRLLWPYLVQVVIFSAIIAFGVWLRVNLH